MGWRVPGTTFIAAGATIVHTFSWPSGSSDKGAQWAMAHPVVGESEAWLTTVSVGKHLLCELGQVVQNGEPVFRCVQTGTDYEYRAFIRNDGTSGCKYQLEGGGVS